jgi:small multidrug resistance pump
MASDLIDALLIQCITTQWADKIIVAITIRHKNQYCAKRTTIMGYIYLAIAILGEVIATSTLKNTAEFTQFWPSVVVVACYGTAFFLLTLVLRTIPVGIAYAIWSGLGIVLVTLAGAVFYRQIPDLSAILGIALIIIGVIVIQLFSTTVPH